MERNEVRKIWNTKKKRHKGKGLDENMEIARNGKN